MKSSREDVRHSLIGGDAGESGPIVYLRQQLSAMGDLRQQIAVDFSSMQEKLNLLAAERLLLAEVIKDGRAMLGSSEYEEINNV